MQFAVCENIFSLKYFMNVRGLLELICLLQSLTDAPERGSRRKLKGNILQKKYKSVLNSLFYIICYSLI